MKNKFIYIALSIAIVIIVIVSTNSTGIAKNRDNKTTGNGFAVVELFTSEGCSSCPSADALVASLPGAYNENVIVLGFHVDYWNRLGWKDAFSDAAFSNRQKRYAQTFNLNSIYTPQVVVNGKTEMVGSDAKHLHAAIDKELDVTTKKELPVTASVDNNIIRVTCKPTANNEVLNIALVQRQASTRVQNGENGGRVLQHINIVRDFKTIAPDKNIVTTTLTLPKGLSAKDCRLIAYVQNTKDLHILNAAEIALQ